MKKILFALLGFMAAAPFAVADNIKMVTYFPVPYASYGDLGVTGTCDVGLLGNCTLDAGEKLSVYKLSSDSRALNTGSLIANRGVLALNSSKSSSEIGTDTLFSRRSGGAQVVAPGVLEFAHDLTVDTIEGATIQSAEATKRADMTDLYLFSPASGRRFPACDATNNKMEWSQLTINGDKGVFLVCGEGVSACQPSYGTIRTGYGSDVTETCPVSNKNALYNCSNGFSGTCMDITRVLQAKFSYSGQGYTADSSVKDTCDGNREAKFSSSPSVCPAETCIDVYPDTSSSSSNNSISAELSFTWSCPAGAGRYEYNGPEALRPGVIVNNVKVLYNQNITTGVDSMADRYCAMYGTGSINTIILVEGSSISSLGCSEAIQRGFYRQISCEKSETKYFYQPGTCQETVQYREVTCCG